MSKLDDAIEETTASLQALLAGDSEPTLHDVMRALRPVGLDTKFLATYEATRVLSLMRTIPQSAVRPLLVEALYHRSVPPTYDPVALVSAVRRRTASTRARSLEVRRRREALSNLSESDRSLLSMKRETEAALVEEARAKEALAKDGLLPVWAAKNARSQARSAKHERIALEDRLARMR